MPCYIALETFGLHPHIQIAEQTCHQLPVGRISFRQILQIVPRQSVNGLKIYASRSRCIIYTDHSLEANKVILAQIIDNHSIRMTEQSMPVHLAGNRYRTSVLVLVI